MLCTYLCLLHIKIKYIQMDITKRYYRIQTTQIKINND